MAVLVWDNVGDRTYETGVDRGVLYLSDGTGVPWNGLTSVTERPEQTNTPVYFDGMKIHELIVLGDFAGTMKALTYPDEFLEIEGIASLRDGIYIGDQMPKTFGLSYRTKVANDLDSDSGYKIHILYNVMAVPKETEYESISDDPTLAEFEWDIFAIPCELDGFRPTAHFIVDTTKVHPDILTLIEEMLYGSVSQAASLISVDDLVELIYSGFMVKFIDNGDGTWTATSHPDFDSLISFPATGEFEIDGVTDTDPDPDVYTVSDVYE